MNLNTLNDTAPPENLVAVYEFDRKDNVWSDWHKTAMLIKHLTWRHLAARYRGSSLGFAWSLLNPLILMGVYTFVFRYIFRATVPGVPFPVFLLTGILAWNFFSSAALNAAVSLVSGASLINKAAFPRIALPVSAVLASAVNYAVTIPILIGFGMLFGVFPTFYLLLLPGALLLILLLAIGVGALLSALMPFFNDLQHLIEVALTIWFFLTPVVYPMSQVPEGLAPFYRLNPMVGLIELVHSVFLGQDLPLRSLATAVAGVVVVLGAGLLVFRRVAKHATEV
jgi:homopolymeric O-antigen transport system permease protein